MVGDKQLNGIAAYLVNLWGRGLYHHAISGQDCASCGQSGHALNLYNTEAAAAVWFQVGVKAQGRDINAGLQGCLQYCYPRPGLNLFTIND
jgi:hypothetical protein